MDLTSCSMVQQRFSADVPRRFEKCRLVTAVGRFSAVCHVCLRWSFCFLVKLLLPYFLHICLYLFREK
jgi:hypothetical protein